MHATPPTPTRPSRAEVQQRIVALFADAGGALDAEGREEYRRLLEAWEDARVEGGREAEDGAAAA